MSLTSAFMLRRMLFMPLPLIPIFHLLSLPGTRSKKLHSAAYLSAYCVPSSANFTAYCHPGWWPAAFSPASGGIPLIAGPYPLASLRRCSCHRVTCSAQKRRAPSFCTVSLSSSSLRTSYPCRRPGKVFRRRYHQPTHGIVFAFRR